MFHTDALFTGVTGAERIEAQIAQLEAALASGRRSVQMLGSWQTYKGRREMEAALAARKAVLA